MSKSPTLIGLMGRPRSGKDFIADKTGIPKFSLGGPLYSVIRYLYPNLPKNTPGYIDTLKKIGQWGRACFDEDFPVSIERINFTLMVREHGSRLFDKSVLWKLYGEEKGLWVYALLQKIMDNTAEQPVNNFTNCIIPDVRDSHDIQLLRERGFSIYLVLCSHETRVERIRSLGEGLVWKNSIEKNTRFEHFSENSVEILNTYYSNYFLSMDQLKKKEDKDLERQFTGKIIWNDTEPVPPHLKYMCITSDVFTSMVKMVVEGKDV